MFDIDDNFLASIGYDLSLLTDDQKNQYKAELTEELQARIGERLSASLDESQVEDFEGIQQSAARANQWLREFHADFDGAEDYQSLVQALGEQEAQMFYAGALWMRHAVPGYGQLVREIFDEYQNELIEKRRMADQAAGL